ncbi:hypothetical protein B0H13DRAFT_1632501, partial [Mycena leptocephala]
PVDQPPELCGELVNGRPTPTYALAWVCPPRTFYENLGGKLGKVNDRNFTNIVSEQWGARNLSMTLLFWIVSPPDTGISTSFNLKPLPWLGLDGNFYLIAMFNECNADHVNRVLNRNKDPLI